MYGIFLYGRLGNGNMVRKVVYDSPYRVEGASLLPRVIQPENVQSYSFYIALGQRTEKG